MITEQHLTNWFTYHPPSLLQQADYLAIRTAAHEFARVILAHTVASADQTAAIRKIREVVMTANASIACAGQ